MKEDSHVKKNLKPTRYNGPVYTLTLPFRVSAEREKWICKAFHIINHIHNELVSYAIGRLNIINNNPEYKKLNSEYFQLSTSNSQSEKTRLREVGARINRLVEKNGLTGSNFEKYASKMQFRYRKYVSSQQVQKEALRVFSGVKKILYSNGKKLHYKRYYDLDTISQKSNKNGVRFNPNVLSFTWGGNTYTCIIPRTMDPSYVHESLKKEISYCDIKRIMFPNGWHYYIVVTLRGISPLVREHAENGVMGIDIGTSTVAGVSDNVAMLNILANGVERYDTEIRLLNQKMDSSRRFSNPDKYNADRTYKKDSQKIRWKFSNRYWIYRRKFKSLNRQKTAFISCLHRQLANKMIRHAVNFVVEDMNYSALAKRSKETKRKTEPKLITDKKGRIRYTRKYFRKKRFGSSILARAPSRFINILAGKACQYGGELVKIDSRIYRASQYDHISDSYTKVPLSQRTKKVGDYSVQRDLYSAFLLKNTDISFMHADRERCSAGFDNFIELQSKLISGMKASGISRKSCFGF